MKITRYNFNKIIFFEYPKNIPPAKNKKSHRKDFYAGHQPLYQRKRASLCKPLCSLTKPHIRKFRRIRRELHEFRVAVHLRRHVQNELKYGFKHGEAVAIGMLMAIRLGEDLGITEKGCYEAINNILVKY